MNQRILFSALTIEIFVAFWPGLLFVLGATVITDYSAQSSVWLFLAQASVPLAAIALGLTAVGIWQKGVMNPKRSPFLIILCLFGIFGTLISVGFGMGVAQWAAMDCFPSNPSKCMLVQAAGSMELYLLPNLATPIVILGWALAKPRLIGGLTEHESANSNPPAAIRALHKLKPKSES